MSLFSKYKFAEFLSKKTTFKDRDIPGSDNDYGMG